MNGKILFVVILLSIMLAACIEGTGPPNPTSSPNDTPTSTPKPTAKSTVTIPTSTVAPTPTPVPTDSEPTDTEIKITTTSQPEISDSWPPENPSPPTSSSSGETINLERGKKYDATVMEA